jgi:hypothetical protein
MGHRDALEDVGTQKTLAPYGLKTWIFQPVASLYTNAILAIINK